MMNQRASNAEIGSNSLNPIENGLLPTRDESPQSLGGPSAVSSMPSQYNQGRSGWWMLTSVPCQPVPAVATNQVALRRNGVPQLTTEKAKAFEIFKQGYPAGDWIDSQKSLLKTKYGEAKALGEKANGYRNEIKTLKARLQSETMDDEAAQQLRITVVDLSTKYKGAYEQLKDLKSEIEHLQHLLEQARLRLTRDFEYWYVNVYLATESPPSQASSDSSSMDVHNVPDFHANVRASDSTLQLGSNYDSRRYMQQDVDSRGRIEESKIPSTSKIGNTIGTTFLEASSMKQPVTEEEPRSRRLEAYNSHTIAPTIICCPSTSILPISRHPACRLRTRPLVHSHLSPRYVRIDLPPQIPITP
ncbi:hypothetical protein BC832DRAFT_64456 [Gaertneriomyces semiglobifer]|nr:hypothetical protein BC832DRAFT_64456 [Gaertneriomyces semiglobifer]